MGLKLPLTICLLFSLLYCFGQNTYVRPIPELRAALDKTTVDTTRAHLLLDLAMAEVYKPGEDPIDLDSALQFIGQADNINSKLHDRYLEAKSSFVRSNALREKGDAVHGIEYARNAIRLFTSTPYRLENGEAYIELAQYYNIYSDTGLTKKRQAWQDALPHFQSGGYKEREAFTLKNLGDLDYMLNNYGQANVDLQQSLAIYKVLHYPAVQGVYDLMGVIATMLGDQAQAVQYGLEAVRAAELVHDTTMQFCTICHRLACAYTAWSKDDEARFYRQKALDIALRYKDQKAIYTVFTDNNDLRALERHWSEVIQRTKDIEQRFPPKEIDDTTILYSSYVQAYAAGGRFSTAKKYASYLAGLTERHKGEYFNVPLQPIFHCLVLYAAAAKQYPQLEKFVDEYITACKTIDYRTGLPWGYMMKARADSGMGNYLTALQWYQQSKRMSDSMFNVAKSMQVSQMQVQFATEKKDKDLELLTNKSQLQELSLKKASLTRNIIIGAAILLLALFYSGYKIKQRHNARLQKLVDEKEWLVREIHHRVKNNLQLVISLLNTQSEFLDDPSAFSAIRESRQRMQAIAIIHQKLYKPDENTFIDMASYIGEVIDHLKDSFASTGTILFQVDVGKISLDVSQAVPLGLIINEAITNSLKHAFPNHRKGLITVSLHRAANDELRLKIIDDGQGFPADMRISESSSMGIQLITLFSEQLEGHLTFHEGPGAGIILVFKPQPSP